MTLQVSVSMGSRAMLGVVRHLAWLGLLLASAALADPVVAASSEEPEKADLQIELGSHSGPIRRIAVDPQHGLVVTGSDDKTARLWSIDTGSMQRVLRPAVGPGERGRVYGVAMHPQQNLIAVSGTSTHDEGSALYVFDTKTGGLVRCIETGPGDIKRLAWTEDGEFIVAVDVMDGGARGRLRVFDVGGDLLFTEKFNAGVYALALAPGRLAVAAFDGTLRIHELASLSSRPQVRLLQTCRVGHRPQSLAFSPDGRALAVGYFQSAKAPDILQWEGCAIQPLPMPAMFSEVDDLRAVAWSAHDGRIVAAGSYGFKQRSVPLVSYDPVRRTLVSQRHAARDSITDLVALPDGRIAYASAEGRWGIALTGDGALMPAPTQHVVAFDDAANLLIDEQGQHVSWMQAGGARPIQFALTQREVRVRQGGDFSAPKLRRGLFNAPQDWRDHSSPWVNGARIALRADEKSRAVSLFRMGDDAVLGTSHALMRIGPEGTVLWRSLTSTEVRAVNTMRDDRLIVSTMLDGSVRFWRADDGTELLALLVLPNGAWIVWSPTGYYDVSPGGETLIGWRVQRGDAQAADFFPAARLRSTYYRPDVITRLLETLDEKTALPTPDTEAAAQAMVRAWPPVVDLLTQADVRTDRYHVGVRVRLRSAAGAPVMALTVRVDGKAVTYVEETRQGAERELTVPLPGRDAQVQIFAENRHGTSEPAVVNVSWSGDAPPTPAKPRLFIVAIGISTYRHMPALQFGAKDAEDFVETMRRQDGRLYAAVEATLLSDRAATRDRISDALRWLQQRVTANDVGMLFLSGHGMTDPARAYHFLSVEAIASRLHDTALAADDIKRAIAGLRGRSVVFIDTCHAGHATTGLINELASAENGAVVFSAATGQQVSVEDARWKNGAFTKALVEGLAGAADHRKSGNITYKGLDYYVSERVKQMTDGAQSPVTLSYGIPDFLLAAGR